MTDINELELHWSTASQAYHELAIDLQETVVPLIALRVQAVEPDVARINFVGSDQGDYLSLDSLVTTSGQEVRDYDADYDSDDLASWISFGDADCMQVPGWHVDDSERGRYHIDVAEALA